jgi:hypothetical protein
MSSCGHLQAWHAPAGRLTQSSSAAEVRQLARSMYIGRRKVRSRLKRMGKHVRVSFTLKHRSHSIRSNRFRISFLSR